MSTNLNFKSMVNSSGQVHICSLIKFKMMKEPRRKYLRYRSTTIKKLKSRRDVVNETSSPNLSQKCSYKYLHWLVVHFAISIVQFNIILFQFKDANHHCLWRKPWRPIQMIQKWSKRTHNCSEFCQDPPESSGRWECPDIRGSVLVNSKYQQTSADPRHVLPQ